MGIDLGKLEKVKKGPDSGHRARCPACASSGEDKKGEHLYIRKDGRFGCAKYPKDKAHRSKIAKLAGDGNGRAQAKRQMPKVVLRPPKTLKHIPKVPFGTVGTPFYNPRACRKKFNTNNTHIPHIIPAHEIGFEKPVPTVPDLHKPLIINENTENDKIPSPLNLDLFIDEAVVLQIDRIKKLFDAEIVAATDGEETVGDWKVAV